MDEQSLHNKWQKDSIKTSGRNEDTVTPRRKPHPSYSNPQSGRITKV